MNVITGPSYYIQNDWDEVLSKISGEVWVTYKNRNENGKHGNIVRVNAVGDSTNPSLRATDGFKANLLTYNAVEVSLTDSEFVSIFIAPRGVYNGIHKKSVTSFDINNDSVAVSVSAENDCEAVTWLVKSEDKLKTFREHAGSIYKCRWFPSGQVILSCGADMSLKIWCSETCRCPVTLRGHTKAVTDIVIVEKGRNVISVSKDGCCKLWDCGEARCIDNIIVLAAPINCCALSSVTSDFPHESKTTNEREVGTEHKIVLVGCEDGRLCCVTVNSRTVLLDLKLDSAVNCCCSIKPTLFAVGCQDGSTSLLKLTPDGKNSILTWRETNSPALCALAYEEKGFFIGHNDGTCIYRTANDWKYPVRLCLTGSNGDPIYDMCCDSKFVYTACRDAAVRKYAPDSYISRHFDNRNSKT